MNIEGVKQPKGCTQRKGCEKMELMEDKPIVKVMMESADTSGGRCSTKERWLNKTFTLRKGPNELLGCVLGEALTHVEGLQHFPGSTTFT